MKTLILLLLIILLGWDVFWWVIGVKPLFPWQLEERLRGDHHDLVLLDVRTSGEFQWFHIPGAKNTPFEKELAKDLQIPKTKTVVVICMTGHRSPLVAYRLEKAGFARVYNLTWGMVGWEVWKRFEKLLPG
jgi:rhodanese-related sulfurtransferase